MQLLIYDPDGNLMNVTDTTKGDSTYAYDTLGRETSRTQPGMTAANTTGYDKAGNVTAVSDPQGTLTYTYDAANHLTSVTEPGGYVTTFRYDANGHEMSRTLPNTVVQTTTRDNSGRPIRIRAVNSAGTVLSDLAYSYTARAPLARPATAGWCKPVPTTSASAAQPARPSPTATTR